MILGDDPAVLAAASLQVLSFDDLAALDLALGSGIFHSVESELMVSKVINELN